VRTLTRAYVNSLREIWFHCNKKTVGGRLCATTWEHGKRGTGGNHAALRGLYEGVW